MCRTGSFTRKHSLPTGSHWNTYRTLTGFLPRSSITVSNRCITHRTRETEQSKTTRMENKAINPADVIGWGVDADPKNDPTYPLKKRTQREHAGYTWERPPVQTGNIEVLHSN